MLGCVSRMRFHGYFVTRENLAGTYMDASAFASFRIFHEYESERPRMVSIEG